MTRTFWLGKWLSRKIGGYSGLPRRYAPRNDDPLTLAMTTLLALAITALLALAITTLLALAITALLALAMTRLSAYSPQELQQALLLKFRDRLNARFGLHWPELVTVPILYCDYPGYFISEHTDAPFKVATMQLYFPQDESQIHLGTSFHLRQDNQFHHLKTNPFKPNSAYAFVRTDNSWHSVKQLGPSESIRNSLALTIYEKGTEYKSTKVYR